MILFTLTPKSYLKIPKNTCYFLNNIVLYKGIDLKQFMKYNILKGVKLMNKIAKILILLIIALFILCLCTSYVHAATTQVIDKNTESKLVEIKENAAKSLEDYQQKYGSEAYGFTAYILNLVRIYSIPFGFIGITISAIYQYIIGIRHLENNERGLVMMVSCITILVICQILPLAFAIVVKFGRG